jgi:nitroreductase
VRGFRPEPVPRPTIERAIGVAGRSPSWCNTQPWELLVTAGGGTERFREALSAAFEREPAVPDYPFPAKYEGAYRARRLETALQLYDAVGLVRGDREASAAQAAKNFRLFDAPHVAVITTDASLGEYGAVDAALFLGNLVLAFEALGVGCVPQAALAAYGDAVRAHFGLPVSRLVLAGVSFGWEDGAHPANGFRTGRVAPSEFTTWIT